jgi:hypothetical protein
MAADHHADMSIEGGICAPPQREKGELAQYMKKGKRRARTIHEKGKKESSHNT